MKPRNLKLCTAWGDQGHVGVREQCTGWSPTVADVCMLAGRSSSKCSAANSVGRRHKEAQGRQREAEAHSKEIQQNSVLYD